MPKIRILRAAILPLLMGVLLRATAAAELVRLDTLMIDQSEVTIQRFAEYVQRTRAVTQSEQDGGGFEYQSGWQRRLGWTWRASDGQAQGNPRLPAVHLTHAEAAAFCAWAGCRLPAAQEWQHAAYTEQRQQPPVSWVRGQRYCWPTGATPEGANNSDPDPWPRARTRRCDTARRQWPARHGRQSVGVGSRRARRRTPHHGLLLVVRAVPDAGRCAGLERRQFLRGVYPAG